MLQIVEKRVVVYYLKKEEGSVVTLYKLKTLDEEYNPLIDFSSDEWEETEDFPEQSPLWKIRTDIKDNVKEEFFFGYEFCEVDSEERLESVCACCAYHVNGVKFRKHSCKHPKHLIKDFVTGDNQPGPCLDYNEYGQCPYFLEPVYAEV